MRKVLVTGGAGFIGSHLVEALYHRGDEVVVIDNLSSGKIENILPFLKEIEFIKGDVTDIEVLKKSMKNVDVVFHHAAIGSVPRSIEEPMITHINNSNGTLNVLITAQKAGVTRVVYAASSSAYGDTPTLPKHENMDTIPKSPYAVSKVTGELYCNVFSQVYGLETVALRYFNVFGPRQDPHSEYAAVIPKFITLMISGISPTIYGDGETSRDFTPVQNVVHANLLASEAENVSGKIFNVALGSKVTLNELVVHLNILLGTSLNPLYEAERIGDVKHSFADISSARKHLRYSPIMTFDEGLEETVLATPNAPSISPQNTQEQLKYAI